METRVAEKDASEMPSLETSLVEWKPGRREQPVRRESNLGNFLSGMETHREGVPGYGYLQPWKLP